MGIVYDPDTDPGAGGSHFTPSGGGGSSQPAPYDPSQDPGVGGSTVSGNAPAGGTGLINRSWVSLADIGKPPPPPSQTPIRDLARNAAAAEVRGSASALDLLQNPSQLVIHPAMVGGAAAYDWLQPKLGLPPMSPEQRADLTGYGAPPEQGGNIATAVHGVGHDTGVDPYAVVPKTPAEKLLATGIEGVIPGMALGRLGPLGVARGGILGGLGAVGGGTAAQYVDPKWQPITELGASATIQGLGGAITPRTGAGLDPGAVRIAQQGQAEGVPFTAPDITPGSIFRTNESVGRTSDALQGNMIRDLGFDPATTSNRVTPGLITQAKTTAGNDMSTITGNNDIGPMQSFRLLQQLQNAERQIDTTAGVTDSDRAQMRARIAEIRGAVNRNTGQMSGSDYQSLTQTDSPLDRLAGNSNSDIASVGRGLMTSLDQAFRTSLSPGDNAAYTNARYRYRLGSTLEPLADKYQGQTLPMSEVADNLYGAQQKYGTIPGSQLDRYMSQAQLIGGGAPPQNPSLASTLASPRTATALAVGGPKGVLAQALQTLTEGAFGTYARNPYRTQDVFARAMDPATRLQQAIAGLTSAGASN